MQSDFNSSHGLRTGDLKMQMVEITTNDHWTTGCPIILSLFQMLYSVKDLDGSLLSQIPKVKEYFYTFKKFL